MTTATRAEIRQMLYDSRLVHYEQEKSEVMQDKDLTMEERLEILESLREKWMV